MRVAISGFITTPGAQTFFFPLRVSEALIDLCVSLNLFTTIHDGNFRRHSSMNVTIK